MAAGERSIELHLWIPFQTLVLSIYLYILYIKLDDTVDEFSEPDLKFFYFSTKNYSLEILKKIETTRTNLSPDPDLYLEHLKNIQIKPCWTWGAEWLFCMGWKMRSTCVIKSHRAAGAQVWPVPICSCRSLFSSLPILLPSPSLALVFLFPPSERPLAVVSLCFCVFCGWPLNSRDTRSCTGGHLIQNNNCHCCGNTVTWVWLDAKIFWTFVERRLRRHQS